MSLAAGEESTERLASGVAGLAEVRDGDAPGWTRRALTEEATAGRDDVQRRMRAAGLECWLDSAGNLIGRLPGRSGGPALVTGSHTDTVLGGGRFDGVIGVLGALEAVELLQAAGHHLEHDLLVVDFYGEEANDFGLSCLGSRALAGTLTPEHLSRTDAQGRTLGAALQAVGIDPHAALSHRWRRQDLHAFVELHIEQGPVLEQAGCAVGVVTAIAAIARAELVFHGRRDHGGTMPVALRHDAACAAAEAVLAVEQLGQDGGIGLAGQMVVSPGAANVVPDLVRLTTEFRSTDVTWMDQRHQAFEAAAREAAERRGVAVEIDWISGEPRVVMDDGPSSAVRRAASATGHTVMSLPSGAGHDTVQMANLTEVGMVFVPSVGGRSHCPEELTDAADVAAGVHVLAQTLLELDRA